ncbi:exodeoxyribonuclease VII large subunit [bacterium]|nr:exodeoxyribonuclease VII large subunit [bacterium]
MSDYPATRPEPAHNAPVFTVSEISGAVKRVIEDGFGYVRVRGEISGLKKHSSGHVYFSLKDQDSVLSSVCWRGIADKLPFDPADGLDVICSGRMTTFGGQSKYQLVVTGMVPAGVGGIMAMLEARKQKLLAEGLFDPARKQPIPFAPRVIGVVTSPTGAVIRDILHRLRERFPVHVIVWPVAVQGEAAAEQIAAAIHGFNQLPSAFADQDASYHAYNQMLAPEPLVLRSGARIPRPDVLIVARGGGSVEDLLCFSEETVVRAAAHSTIPIISAIGHETDTTLMDFVADRRAPTPTAAAEMAVPVRQELMAGLAEAEMRMARTMLKRIEEHARFIQATGKGLPNPVRLLESGTLRLDNWGERLHQGLPAILMTKSRMLRPTAIRFRPPLELLQQAEKHVRPWDERLRHVLPQLLKFRESQLHQVAGRLNAGGTLRELGHVQVAVDKAWQRVGYAFVQRLNNLQTRLHSDTRLLESYHYKRVLKRGFALIRDEQGEPVYSAEALKAGQGITIELQDGSRRATVEGGKATAAPSPVKKPESKPMPANVPNKQTSLF